MGWTIENLSSDERASIAEGCFQISKRMGDEMHGFCPAHDDKNPSFSYNPVKDACKCLACNFKGDLITLWGQANNYVDNSEAFKAFATQYGSPSAKGPQSTGRALTQGKKGVAGAPPEKEEATIVIPDAEYLALSPLSPSLLEIVKGFGWSPAVIERFDIRQIRRGPDTRIAIPIRIDGGALVNIRLYLPGVKENKVIAWGKGYGKNKLFPAPESWGSDTIILCEGEKDCLTALSHNLNAVTQTAGASSWDGRRFNRFFAKRKVVIAYDNDGPGLKGAKSAAESLSKVAAQVSIIKWPPIMQDGHDICDWFTTHGKSLAEFNALVMDAEIISSRDAGTSREERASMIPEEQQPFFVGKQFKPRLLADYILSKNLLCHDPVSNNNYLWTDPKWSPLDKSFLRRLIHNALGIESNTARTNDVYSIIEDLAAIESGRKMNDMSGNLPLKNGMLEISSGNLLPHVKENYNTYCLDVSLDLSVNNDCPLWKKFLDESIGDNETIAELQKFFGYCYTRETRYEKALFFIGPGGDGKGTIIKVLRSILGEENCSNIGLDSFAKEFKMVDIVDKLLNSTTEISSEMLQSNVLQMAISGEPFQVSKKFQDVFNTSPVAKHVFSSNMFPDIKNHTDGLFRRLMFIEMDKQFVASGKVDFFLFDDIIKERDGIFLWGLRGLQRLLSEKGFKESQAMQTVLETFKQKNSPLYLFAVDHIKEANEHNFCPSLKIYDAYKKFCFARGNQPYSLTNTMLMLRNIFPCVRKGEKRMGKNKFTGYYGIELVEGADV